MENCFFCNPDQSRVLYETENFYTLLGLGPIIEGYILLVARSHIRSMLDLPVNVQSEYLREKKRLKDLTEATYGPTIITEHGRVQACVAEDMNGHEDHCFHAHQLFFPVDVDLSRDISGPFKRIYGGPSLFEIDREALGEREYLLFEDSDGSVACYMVEGKCPRQYMRYLVASETGDSKLFDWRQYPRWDLIDRARAVYREKIFSLNK